MSRPCECRRAGSGPYDAGQCYLCWLAANVPEYAALYGEPPPADPQTPPPAPPPGGARRGRRGLGDDVAWLARVFRLDRLAKRRERRTGRPCGCGRRRRWLNRLPSVTRLWPF